MDASAAMSLTLLSTLDKLSSSPRSSGASTSGVASLGTPGISAAPSEPEWPADSCDELDDLGIGLNMKLDERSVAQGSMLSLSPAPGLRPSPTLSALALSPAPGLTASPAFVAWPSTPEFTPLMRPLLRRMPLLGPLDLGHAASSPEQSWSSTPELTPLCGPLDLGSTMLPPVQELPAAADADEESPEEAPLEESHPASAPSGVHAESAFPLGMPLLTMEQYAAQHAAMLAYFSAAYQPFTWPLAAPMPIPTAAPQRAAAPKVQTKKNDTKPLIFAKPGRDFHEPAPGVPRTTLLLRNMPNNQTRKVLMEILDREGFERQYDFLYLPMDFQSRISMGYSFVNFTTESAASRAKAVFEGYTKWRIPSRKVCGVSWSYPHQGFDAHVERYRNSPVMHEDTPDHYKPLILREGQRVPFPAATQQLKAPRQRNSKVAK